jgi:glutamate carboxypeptidase
MDRAMCRKLYNYCVAITIALALHGAAPVRRDLLGDARQAKPEVIKLLERLVNIDSGTGSEKGLDQVGAIVADEANKLGMRVELSSALPAAGKNLVATLNGTGRARIPLMAHMDTVFADGTATTQVFRIQSDRVYGSGVMDDKGGIVTALFAIRLLLQMKFTDFKRIIVLVNTNEETSSKGTVKLMSC